MSRHVLVVLILVLLVAPAAAEIDLQPIQAAIETRCAEIGGDSPYVGHEREYGALQEAREAFRACQACAPEIDRCTLRRGVKRIERSGTGDRAIRDELALVLERLVAEVETCIALARIEPWTMASTEDRHRASRLADRAEESLESGLRAIADGRMRRAARKLGRGLKLAWKVCPPVPEGTITILQVSDDHGHIDRYGPKGKDLVGRRGGLSRVATVVGAVREASPATLFYHCGDFHTGTLFHNRFLGIPALRIYADLRLDGMVPGNHEFDLGPDAYAYTLSEAIPNGEIPILGANLDVSGYPALGNWIASSRIQEIDGVPVGVFGLTTPDDPVSRPDPVVIDDDVLGIAYVTAQQLRAQGARVVICLSHLGLLYDDALARNVPGIDLILGGHEHALLAEPRIVENPLGTPTVITHVGSNLDRVGRIRIRLEGDRVVLHDFSLFRIDHRIPSDPGVQAVVDGLRAAIDDEYGPMFTEVIARAKRTIAPTWDADSDERDTALGNLVTDSGRLRYGTELCLAALGLIRDPIFVGPIVRSDVFQAVGYGFDPESGLGFRMATARITGMELIRGLETGLAYYGLNDDFFIQVSGMEFRFDPSRAVGERVLLETVRIGGEPLDPTRSYSLAVNTGIVMLLPLLGVEVTDVEYRVEHESEVLEDHIAALGKVDVRPEGRIREVR